MAESTTTKPASKSKASESEPDATLSRDARFSTYSENTDVEDANPPNGKFTVETLGTPTEGSPPSMEYPA